MSTQSRAFVLETLKPLFRLITEALIALTDQEIVPEEEFRHHLSNSGGVLGLDDWEPDTEIESEQLMQILLKALSDSHLRLFVMQDICGLSKAQSYGLTSGSHLDILYNGYLAWMVVTTANVSEQPNCRNIAGRDSVIELGVKDERGQPADPKEERWRSGYAE